MDRNYLPHADKVKATCVYTHGLQDWNVKPRHIFNIFNALPSSVEKHAFLHNGEHVYMHNWQSIDFRESMNALLSQKLLGQDNHFVLPTLIWQDNSQEQAWTSLAEFGSNNQSRISELSRVSYLLEKQMPFASIYQLNTITISMGKSLYI